MTILAEKIRVMQAAEEGRTIEYCRRRAPVHRYEVIVNPSWDWDNCNYRVAAEKIRYRRYLIRTHRGPMVFLVNSVTDEIYRQPQKGMDFIRWLDDDWVEVEV